MFVEEGFRIRFANGEVIDFYADSREQKEAWMKVLSETVGKDIAQNKGWAAMVLEKERKEKALKSTMGTPTTVPGPGPNRRPSHTRTQSHDALASMTSPRGHARTQSHAPAPPLKDVRMSHAPPPRPRTQESSKPGRREQVRSMIF